MNKLVKFKRGHLYYPEISIYEMLEDTAKRFPQRFAFLYPKKLNFQDFKAKVDIFATILYKLNIKKGDRIALFAPNSIEWEICFYGLEKIGGILVPMNPQFKETEVKYEIEDSGAEVIIVSQNLFPIVKKVKEQIKLTNIIIIDDKIEEDLPSGVFSWQKLMSSTEPITI